MKKIISILLAVLLIFSLSACSFMDEETKGKWEELGEAFEELQEDLKEIEEDSNKELEPFSYKMAKVFERHGTDDNGVPEGYLLYALELKAEDYQALNFEVYDKNGNHLSDETSRNPDNQTCRVRVTLGGVCLKDDIEHVDDVSLFTGKFDPLSEDHHLQYVISVEFKKEDYSFKDIVVKASLYEKFTPDTKKEVSFEINATLDDITTKQKYMHSNCIINLDGVYFFYEGNVGTGSSNKNKDNEFAYTLYELSALQRETISDLNGKIEFVDKEGNKLTAPDGFEFHAEIEEEESEEIQLFVGLRATGDKKFSNEMRDIVNYVYLRYTDTDGHSTILFGQLI